MTPPLAHRESRSAAFESQLGEPVPSTIGPQMEDQQWYVLQNWRPGVVVNFDEAEVLRERVFFFSPYGRVFGMPAGVTGFEGDYGTGNSTAISGWSAAYRAYADASLDGTIDATDATGNTHATLGWDTISRDECTIGMIGANISRHIPVLALLRQGVYHTKHGRMLHRSGNTSGVGVGFGTAQPCHGPCGCGVGADVSLGGCSWQPTLPIPAHCVASSPRRTRSGRGGSRTGSASRRRRSRHAGRPWRRGSGTAGNPGSPARRRR